MRATDSFNVAYQVEFVSVAAVVGDQELNPAPSTLEGARARAHAGTIERSLAISLFEFTTEHLNRISKSLTLSSRG